MSPGEVIPSRAAPRRRGLPLLVPALLLAAAWPAAAAPRTVAADDRALASEALRVATGEPLVVEGLWLERDAAPVAVELERIEVWAPGAVVEVDGERRPAPASAVFRGQVRGYLDSIAVLTVAESGETGGLLLREGEGWVLDREPGGAGGLASRRVDMAQLEQPFACGNEDPGFRRLSGPALPFDEPATLSADTASADTASADLASADTAASYDDAASTTAASHTAVPYTATLALETDAEYYGRFAGSADPQAAALDYLALLVAYGDVVYSREVDTAMRIGFARLWTGGTGSDPWTITTGTIAALFEFQDHWNANMSHVERTAAHLVSGKNLGGGVAYLGTLCQSYTNPGSSNDYGLSANISGGFSWNGDPASDPSAVVWDVIVVLHELGHNFNSPHSHDYCGLGGSNLPIDRCYASEKCGAATGLPSCSSPTPHFSGGAGTIMSYCHFQRGSYGNIAMTFGEEHTCGDLPWRQADRMSAHVANRAASVSACFAPGGGTASACPADLLLTSQTISDTRSFEAQNTITAGSGFAVGSKGDVTFHAGGSVALGDGFSVAGGGSLRVVTGTTPSCS